MKLINIGFIIFIIILFILYINYSKGYTSFIINENDLEKLSNKIYYLKNEYDYKRKILKQHRELLNIDDLDYYNNIEYLNNNYNNSLRLINIEIEQIKNLNKIYEQKFKDLDNINNLYILKKDYNKELYKIQDIGYNMIMKLERDNSNLINNLYHFNIKQIQNKDIELYEIQKNYKTDIECIKQDYTDKLNILKNKLESKLKKKENKKYKCKLHISWEDQIHIIKCCSIKK